MKTRSNMPAQWRRNVLALAASLCVVATTVQAQQTAGSVSGAGGKGDVVSVENRAINISRQATVGDDGTWQLTQLPAGTYTVTVTRANGTKEATSVIVRAGEGSTVAFPSAAQVVTITGSAIRTLDMMSTTSNFGISADEIDRIPVAQNVAAVTLLSPGAVLGDGRLGQVGNRPSFLPSLGGASIAENAYYINGFNVTNITKGVAFNTLPFSGIGSLQVLSSGYSVEFGRSLGGVVSVNSKRGTNEWKGGVYAEWQPDFLRGSSVYADKSEKTGEWNLVEREGSSDSLTVGAYISGPIIQDRLFIYALAQGQRIDTELYNESNQTLSRIKSPSGLIKLDWNITDNHLLELTYFDDTAKETADNYQSPSAYSGTLGTYSGTDEYKSGGSNLILKWTGALTQDLTLSAMYGKGEYSRNTLVGGADCPAVYDGSAGSLKYKGCWSEANLVVDNPDNNDERTAFRLDLEWNLGNHQIRAGLDNEEYITVDGGQYSGGNYYRTYAPLAPGRGISGTDYVNNTGAPLPYVRDRILLNGGTFKTENSAWYVEDNWQVTKNLLLNLGVRGESFTNYNDVGQPFIDVSNTIAPRGGVAWDVRGDGMTKAYANLGRYYIPVYANTNARLAGRELFTQDYYAWDGTFSNDRTQVPGKGAFLGQEVLSDGAPRNPATLTDLNLDPMYQDELVLGIQQAVSNRWTLGAKYTHRTLKSAMDDFGDGTVARRWADGAGYTPDQAAAIEDRINGYVLMNPGKDLTLNVDLDGTGELTAVRIPAAALLLDEPKRTYDALELTADRQWDGRWEARASYVLAYSKGNTEGYVKSDIGQDDAGITQDWDHPSWMEGSSGYLPNDRRHTIKLTGAYGLTDEWRIGGSVLVQSGRPKNCFGVYNGSIVDDGSGPNSFYCNGEPTPRGSQGRTEWRRDFGASLTWMPTAVKGLMVSASVLNILDDRSIGGISETGEDAGGGADPNYKRPIISSVQAPRRWILSMNYDF